MRHILVVAAVGLLATGCLKRIERQRLETRAPIALAMVLEFDQRGEPQAVPQKLWDRVANELNEQNLEAKAVAIPPIAALKVTGDRLKALDAEAGDAPYLLLAEVRPTFFSQLDGRWRYTVGVKLTAARKGQTGEALTDSFSAPATLLFNHEREPEAAVVVKEEIASRSRQLLDALLARNNAPPPVQKPVTRRAGDSIYFVMVDRFANGNPANDGAVDLKDGQAFHGGDLEGLIGKLDWLQSLGVRTVWLSPVFAMRTEKYGPYGAYHGYWTYDLSRVEPRFGDEALLKKLSSELHARKMRLLLDTVLNHVGPGAPLATQKPEWFHHEGPMERWDDPNQVETHDVAGLPDFASEKPEVFRYLTDATKRWVDAVRPDGLRLDAVKHVPSSFWSKFNAELLSAAGAEFELLGEVLEGDSAKVSKAQREGGFTEMFDFPLHFAMVDVFCKGTDPARLGAVITDDRRYADPAGLVTLVDNHDLPRITSQCEKPQAVDDALKFLLATRGTPSLTWGTEVGLTGAKEPDNRADMKFVEHPRRALIAQALKARAENPALAGGAPRTLEAREGRFVQLRAHADQLALIVVNRGESNWSLAPSVDPSNGAWTEKPSLSGQGTKVFVTATKPGAYAELANEVEHAWRTGEPRQNVEVVLKKTDGEYRLVGSGEELGAWKVEAGLKLVSATTTVSLPRDGVFEFKLVRLRDGAPQWETGPNRVLHVTRDVSRYELEWRG